ncbi:MAG: leucine-rich repeat protein, partial [Bacteroidaceae bacterium]|nr:leucine-rich repeat protein [Bacteroidaceae bacterium]
MRKLLLTITLILFTFLGAHAEIYSETVDKKIRWSVDTETGILLLTSSGNQNSVTGKSTPWKQYSDYISIIVLGDGITQIGPDVLNDLPNVSIIIFDNNKGAGDIPNINPDNLADTNLEDVIIVVPESTTDDEIQSILDDLGSDALADNIYKGNYDEIAIGKCGDNLSYIYYKIEKNLVITGSGAMYDYTPGTAPWYDNRADIQTVEVDSKATTIGNYAFDGCTTLATVTLNSNAAIGTGAVPSSAATHLILQDKQPLLMNNNTFGSVSYV